MAALYSPLSGALFLTAVRLAGSTGRVDSPNVALACSQKNLGPRLGKDSRLPFRPRHHAHLWDFGVVASLSIAMWLLDRGGLLRTLPCLLGKSGSWPPITASKCVLLMVVSGGASVVQLPVLGWFTQIGVVAAAITGIFGANTEAATACAAMLLLITFLGIVPVGLIWAQFDHVSLRKVTVESEHAEEESTKLAKPLSFGVSMKPAGSSEMSPASL